MHRSRLLCFALGLLVSLAAISPAWGATISYTSTAPLANTDWTVSLSFPQHNPASGPLQSVAFLVRDSLVATFRYENLSVSSVNSIRDSSKATVTLQRPDNSVLLSVISAVERRDNLPVYDGVTDFGGLSGRTIPGVVGYNTDSYTTTAPADLTLFTGTGSISLPCKAVGRSYTSDTAGNVIHWITTQALARVTVTYTYDPGTPAARPTWGRIKSLYR
jgi:hypothetical protein